MEIISIRVDSEIKEMAEKNGKRARPFTNEIYSNPYQKRKPTRYKKRLNHKNEKGNNNAVVVFGMV